jgi:putative transposase
VHFIRDMLGHVPRQAQPMARRALKQIFAAPDRVSAGETLAAVVDQLQAPAAKVARLLADAEEELLAYMRFPREHWPKIRSPNPLERVNLEIARRSDIVGIYPNDAALLRLATSLLVEQTTNGSSRNAISRSAQSPSSPSPAGSPTTTSQRYTRARWPSSESPPHDGT